MGERPNFLVANSNQQSGKSTSSGFLCCLGLILLSCLSHIRQLKQRDDAGSTKTTKKR